MRLHPDEWSHRDSPTEATFTLIDEVSFHCDICFIHTLSISFEKKSCRSVFALHLFSLSFPSHHTYPYTSAHTYLFIIFMHACTYSEDSPQDFWLQLDCFVFIWEILDTLYFYHMNTK